MTREILTLTPIYQISGDGPYTIMHPYRASDDLIVSVNINGVNRVLLQSEYTVTPETTETSGSIYLMPGVVAAGGALSVLRKTPQEQGWIGQTAREKGLEAQLDILTMGIQEIETGIDRSFKVPLGQSAGVIDTSVPGSLLKVGENGNVVPGPTAVEIDGAVEAGSIATAAAVRAEAAATSIEEFAEDVEDRLTDLESEPGGVGDVLSPLENLFLASHFLIKQTQSTADTTVHLSTSMDGLNFGNLNGEPLRLGPETLSADGPALTFHAGKWWLFSGASTEGSHDFVVYVSNDLITWSKRRIAMSGGPYISSTVSTIGGSSPTSKLWVPDPVIVDGKLYVVVSMRYGANATDAYGNTVETLQSFLSECTDTDDVVFGAPVKMNVTGTSHIDAQIVEVGGTFYHVCKNDIDKTTEIHTSSSLKGTYTLQQTISHDDFSLEGQCLTPFHYYSLNSDVKKVGWRLYIDVNRTSAGASSPNKMVGAPHYYELLNPTPSGSWGTLKRCFFDTPVRHGSVLNLAFMPEEATRSLQRAAAGRNNPRDHMGVQFLLSEGDNEIWPEPDVVYYVNGSIDATLTLRDGAADRFFIGLFTKNNAAGITIPDTDAVAGPLSFGYGDGGDYVVEFRRRGDSGAYFVANTPAKASPSTPKVQGMVGIAHRGMSGTAPENTLPAYSLAVSNGFKYLEGDLRMTSDGVWVMLHDATVDRTSDGTGNIADMTLATARTYDFGSWKNAAYAGTEIPTAEEFFNLCFRQNATPVIEVKFRATQAEIDQLVDIAVAAGVGDRIIYSSFESADMELVLNKDPKANVAHISSLMSTELIAEAVALKTGQNNVSMVLNNANITAALAEDALAAGLTMFAYTVNDSSLLLGLSEKGVTGVITDTLNIASLLEGLDGVSGTEGGSFDYSKLVPGVFFNNPHYEYSGTTLYVKPSAFGATSNVAYIRGGSLPDDEWTYAELKADLATFTAPSFAATGITSPSGVTDCIRLGNETTIWYDPVTQGWGWGGRDLVDLTGKVKVLENNYGQLGDCSERPQAVLKLAAASAGGLDHWDETATQFFPAVDGGAIGTSTKRIREVSLLARAGDGTAGDNHGALFLAQSGNLRIADAGATGDNEGRDVGAFHRAYDAGAFDSTVGGTYVWDKQKGQGINFSLTLTSALTVDITDLKIGEEIRIRVRDPDSNTISFTLPSGSITWVGGAVTPATSEIIYVLWRLGVSNIIGIAVEV